MLLPAIHSQRDPILKQSAAEVSFRQLHRHFQSHPDGSVEDRLAYVEAPSARENFRIAG